MRSPIDDGHHARLARPTIRRGLLVEVVDGEAIVLDERNGTLHRCNGSATIVLRSCDGERNVDAIVTDIANRLGCPEETVRADVSAALQQLRRAGLVGDSSVRRSFVRPPGSPQDPGRDVPRS